MVELMPSDGPIAAKTLGAGGLGRRRVEALPAHNLDCRSRVHHASSRAGGAMNSGPMGCLTVS